MGKKRRQAADDEEEWGAGSRALAAQGGGVEDKSKREDKCRAHLRALNKQFSSWVDDQTSKRPMKSWAAGCQDYLKHIGQIKADFQDVLEGETGGGAGGAPRVHPHARWLRRYSLGDADEGESSFRDSTFAYSAQSG